MHEQIKQYLTELLIDLANTDMTVALAVILLCSAFIILDAVSMAAKKKREKSGLSQQAFRKNILANDNKALEPHHYVSDMQLLSGTPDAIINENGFFIPVEYKPLAKKIRDRYVVQILVHMRLIEEFKGKKPPYGYLVLGKNRRRIKIQNSIARQAWLQKYIDEMQEILQDIKSPIATPQKEKCSSCSVKTICQYSSIR